MKKNISFVSGHGFSLSLCSFRLYISKNLFLFLSMFSNDIHYDLKWNYWAFYWDGQFSIVIQFRWVNTIVLDEFLPISIAYM